jgi:hemerythrin-like domain-containing protein
MITLQQIARASRANDEPATVDRPLEHLLACHRRIEERLATLDTAGRHLHDRRDEALQAISNSLAFFDVNVARHSADEEESIFPRLRERLPASDLRLLNRLEDDHAAADKLLGDLRGLFEAAQQGHIEAALQSDFIETVQNLTDLFRVHIAAEDEHLIALATSALDSESLIAIADEMKARRGR